MDDYFKVQLELLKLERRVDEETYQQLIRNSSVQQQRENGYVWYPIAIRGQEEGRGGFISIEAERTTHQHVIHSLQSGRRAELFSNYDREEPGEKGIIQHVGGNRLRITLMSDELPDWVRQGKLGIRALFDDDSYDAMELALKTAGGMAEKNTLIRILTGRAAATFSVPEYPVNLPDLNESQNAAVNKIISAVDLAIVHGPPGTGKTTTLVAATQELLKKTSKPILAVAPSNTAIDLLCERLAQNGVRVVRIGNPVRVSDQLQELTLDHRISVHPEFKRIRELRKRASEFRNMAHKYKRSFGPAEREQRKALFAEAGRISHEVSHLEDFIVEDELHRAQVIAATPVGAYNYAIRDLSFDTVIIDEAGQALEAACWIPILKARKVILAGDHLQLPPTVKSEEAARKGLSISLMEKCVAMHPEATVLLNEQYRMHEQIMHYPSAFFYESRLLAHESVRTKKLHENDLPLEFIDTAGCGFEEEPASTSFVNPEEGQLLVNVLFDYLRNLQASNTTSNSVTIGVLSPYKQQVELLKNLVASHPGFQGWASSITVNTIDGFQGQERDIMVIGMVRSNTEGKTGFLNETRRMNVAMTRARKKLIVIGDSATLSAQPFYENFIAYAQEKEAYRSAWEFMES